MAVMTCIKTGAHILAVPHHVYALGDAYELEGVTYFRLCATSDKPIRNTLHFLVDNWQDWFGRFSTTYENQSVLICNSADVKNLGYDGVPL